jgi:hypothetical protein
MTTRNRPFEAAAFRRPVFLDVLTCCQESGNAASGFDDEKSGKKFRFPANLSRRPASFSRTDRRRFPADFV